MELSFNTLEAGRVDCRTNIDRGRQEADLECDEELLGCGPISWVIGVVGAPINEESVDTFFIVGKDRRLLWPWT